MEPQGSERAERFRASVQAFVADLVPRDWRGIGALDPIACSWGWRSIDIDTLRRVMDRRADRYSNASRSLTAPATSVRGRAGQTGGERSNSRFLTSCGPPLFRGMPETVLR